MRESSQRPVMTLDNQQRYRHVATEMITVTPNGDVRCFERFTAAFQTPNFDFRRFPFDEQKLHIDMTSVLPTNFYVIDALPGFSGVDDDLGEEE